MTVHIIEYKNDGRTIGNIYPAGQRVEIAYLMENLSMVHIGGGESTPVAVSVQANHFEINVTN